MRDIHELQRLESPAPRPQALAWDGTTLWMGSRETRIIYAIDPLTWTVRWQIAAPGTPYGITAFGGELRVVCGDMDEDNRTIRRCLPNRGFDPTFALRCPDDTGSQLSYDGRYVHVSQWYAKKLIALDETGQVLRTTVLPHEICGHVFVDGCFYVVTTDDEETTDYWLTRVDLRTSSPKIEDLARIPFGARALAFDGTNFWTNHREKHQIVSFARPDA